MSQSKGIIFYPIFFLVLFIHSCKVDKGLVRLNNEQKTELDSAKYKYALIEGEKNFLLGNYNDAYRYMKECIRLNPEASVPYYNLAKMEYGAGNILNAKTYIDSAIARNDRNKWYYKLSIQMSIESKQYDQALKSTGKLIELEPENIENYSFKADLYLSMNNYKEALKTYENIEQIAGFNESLSLEKIKLYDLVNETEKAKEELLKLINISPDVAYYYGLLAEFYIEQIEYEKALEAFNKVSELDPENGLVHMSLYEFYMKIGNLNKALHELEAGIKNDNVPFENKIQAIIQLGSLPDTDTLEKKIDHFTHLLSEEYPDEPRINLMIVERLMNTQQYDSARTILIEFVDTIKNNYFVWQQLMLVENLRNDNNSLLENSEKALEYFPNQAIFYFFNGIANYNLNKYKAAIEMLEIAEDFASNNELKRQVLTFLAESYYRQEKLDKSFALFDKALAINYDDTYILNNYSYYLALEGLNLEKADSMMQRCLQLDASNSSYLDTYAWVLYKMGKYKEALQYIEEAYHNGGDKSEVIIEHYGDILYKLGKKEKALIYWEKSKDMGNESKDLENKILNKGLVNDNK